MKLNRHLQRCHHGSKGKMAPSSKQEAKKKGEVVMNIPHMEDEEVMNKEEGQVDVVATTMVARGRKRKYASRGLNGWREWRRRWWLPSWWSLRFGFPARWLPQW